VSLKRTDVLHGLVAGAQSERWNGLIVTANEKAQSMGPTA
jgi:hypothetical protein